MEFLECQGCFSLLLSKCIHHLSMNDFLVNSKELQMCLWSKCTCICRSCHRGEFTSSLCPGTRYCKEIWK